VRTAQGYEVDFLATHYDGTTSLIQVCADLNDAPTRERETRALREAKREHPAAQCLIILMEPPTRPVDIPGIQTLLAVDWLLDKGATSSL
jgi:predicted AAA+ superfamily ATPase